MNQRIVLILGGYGTFGRLIAQSLARHPEVGVVVAGRNLRAATQMSLALGSGVRPLRLDCETSEFEQALAVLRPAVVIDTVGPFQIRDYRVARACIAGGAHYVDLADGRDYVSGIGSLHESAAARGVLVASGASTCPALSTAVVDRIAGDLAAIQTVSLGISPGQRAPRGLATARSVLRYCGKPIPARRNGRATTATGWSGLLRHTYPQPAGARWLSRVDMPEIALWPARFPTLRDIETRAGFEISVLHLGLTALSWAVRAGLVTSLASSAQSLLRVARWFDSMGTAVGAMYVSVTGRNAADTLVRRTWSILAERGDGPRIPASPAIALTKGLLEFFGGAPISARGAMPCMGIVSYERILAELAPFAIRTRLEEETLAL